ncbi:HAD-IC family P-type ATPase [Gordonia alkaliphila]|uniref:HAD-IC family P-type ATPase n=1 Tax=Gordonia alkaliphila TaxID=1053547 RepID=UPI0031F19F3A
MLFNAGLGFAQDRKAEAALAALQAGLAPSATVLRDGTWSDIDAANLVPGDVVRIEIGEVVPADLRLTGSGTASIDQSALTGESVPVRKHPGDPAFSGSVVKGGDTTGVVIATGTDTMFGKTAKLVAGAGAVSHAQKAMFQIGDFLIAVAVALAVILVFFEVFQNFDTQWSGSSAEITTHALGIVQFVLVLLVASIPVAMPAVFSVTMALGALELSKHKAIVSRLESIEEMAGVDTSAPTKPAP